MICLCLRSVMPSMRPNLIAKLSASIRPIANRRIKPIQYVGYTFCTIKSPQLSSYGQKKQDQTLKKLLQSFEKRGDKFDEQEIVSFTSQLVRAANNRGISMAQSLQISSCLGKVFHRITENLQQIIRIHSESPSQVHRIFALMGFFCMQNISRLLERTQEQSTTLQQIKNSQFLEFLLTIFQHQTLKNKSRILKFIAIYHGNNTQASERIAAMLRKIAWQAQSNVNETIFFLKEATSFLMQTPDREGNKIDQPISRQFLEKAIEFVNKKIMLVTPKMLYIFTKFLAKMNINQKMTRLVVNCYDIQAGVEQHINGLKLIESFNSIDAIYLLQVLENMTVLVEKQNKPIILTRIRERTVEIYEMIKKIHQSDNQQTPKEIEQEEDASQQTEQTENDSAFEKRITKKQELRLIDVNIILQSMLNLSVIDARLFSILQQMFFKHVPSSALVDIKSYMIARIRVTKAVIASLQADRNESTPEKLRLIKQEHKRFVTRLLEEMNTNNSLSFRQKLLILQICQQITAKSRQIKKVIAAMASQGNVTQEQLGFAQIIMNGF